MYSEPDFQGRIARGKSMSDDELIKKCDEWIYSLAESGGKSWCLSIPVRYDVDPDMLFTELISRYQFLRSELQKQKELNADLVKGLEKTEKAFQDSCNNYADWLPTQELTHAITLIESLIKKSKES